MAQGKGGGPQSLRGRANSSRNSLKHGMRAKKFHIMADESEADFKDIERSWNDEWQPEGYKERRLVEILVHNDWLLKRGFKRAYEAVNSAAGEENLPPEEWSTEATDNVNRMLQYKAQAERSFYRSLNALEQLKKDLVRMDEKLHKLLKENRKLEDKIEDLEKRVPQAPDEKPVAEEPEMTPAQIFFQGQLNEKKQPKRAHPANVKLLEEWEKSRAA